MNQFYETPTAQPEDDQIITEQTWYCFQTPVIEITDEMTLIGMVDASGSMQDIWPKLVRKWNKFIKKFESVYTITFSESPLIRTPQLQENIYYHGGFQTNIYKSFIGLKRLLQSNKPKFKNITIIFISDGVEECRDTSLHQEIQGLNLESLNNEYNIQFICVGIGKQFSSTFAIRMRNIFYQTHYATPNLITIEAETVQLSNLFHNDLPKLIRHKQIGISKEIIFQYPWDTQGTNKIYSESILFSKKGQLSVEFNNQKYKLEGKSKLQMKDCIEISQRWHRQLITQSEINNQSQQAHIALSVLKQFSNQKNFKLTVWERIQLNKCKKNSELKYFMHEIKKIYMNQILTNLTDKEQLSRQKIHTYQSKHHQQLLQMAGISEEEFNEAKQEFITLLQTSKLINQSNQECSIVSMQNTIDVLMENDIIQALFECQNQYELVQCFPLIGQGLQIKRSESTVFSEYQIKVLSMARHHKTIDSVSMLQKEYEIHLQTGDGDEEIINCIIPLFENEIQLQPFISSKLYNMLVSYNITQNIDTFLDESYLSLLASCLVYLICQKPSDWQRQLLNQIRCTFDMLQIQIDKIKEALLHNLNECFITVNQEKQIQCQNPIKILLIAYCYDMIDFKFMERLFLEQIGRRIDRDIKISDYFEFYEPPEMEDELQKINVEVNQEYILRTFYSFSELNVQVVHAYDDKLQHLVNKLEIKPPEIKMEMIEEQLKDTVLELEVMQKIIQYFCNTQLSKDQVIILFYHAYCNAKSVGRNRNDVVQDLEFILDEIRLAKYRPCIKQQKIEKLNFFKQIYQKEIQNTHKGQKPLTMIQKQFMPNLQLHPEIGIVINACMSADCPHYLEVRADYDKHVQSNSLCFLPNSIYQEILYNRKKSIQQIFDKISQNIVCRKSFLTQLLKDPLIVYLKIRDAQQVYNTYL